jgi:hypothetical protein
MLPTVRLTPLHLRFGQVVSADVAAKPGRFRSKSSELAPTNPDSHSIPGATQDGRWLPHGTLDSTRPDVLHGDDVSDGAGAGNRTAGGSSAERRSSLELPPCPADTADTNNRRIDPGRPGALPVGEVPGFGLAIPAEAAEHRVGASSSKCTGRPWPARRGWREGRIRCRRNCPRPEAPIESQSRRRSPALAHRAGCSVCPEAGHGFPRALGREVRSFPRADGMRGGGGGQAIDGSPASLPGCPHDGREWFRADQQRRRSPQLVPLAGPDPASLRHQPRSPHGRPECRRSRSRCDPGASFLDSVRGRPTRRCGVQWRGV